MTKGLVLGKFMPLHKGHLELIHYARRNCDALTVLLCYTESEPINGAQRLIWLNDSLKEYPSVRVESYLYDEKELSASSRYSEEASVGWSAVLKEKFPDTDIFFSAEAYGEAVARHSHWATCSSVNKAIPMFRHITAILT